MNFGKSFGGSLRLGIAFISKVKIGMTKKPSLSVSYTLSVSDDIKNGFTHN